MTDETDDQPPGNLPALVPLFAAPERSEGGYLTFAAPDELKPEDMTQVLQRMFDLVSASKSDPARVSAAKLLLDRFAPPEDPEQKRREAEERDAAIAEAKCLMAEFEHAKLAGLCEPSELAEIGEAAADNAADGNA